jgi:threonylcarbamoyladenosine tRNA methylthiotransferase MtaB
MKYAVITFGCRVNQADSLGFEEELRARGASAAAPENADVVVVNTCSVTGSADQAARQTVRRVARVNPHARIVVTGCYATRRPDELRRLPGVSAVVPNDDKPQLVPIIGHHMTTAERFGDGDGECGAPLAPGIAGRTAFTLRVQTGCAEACSYCIIPLTRGAPRSVPIESVVREVNRIAAAGFKEITLTGVHLGSYGRDLDRPRSLRDLLYALARRPHEPHVRFRLSSLEPMDCSSDIVALVSEAGCFAPHFHLPLQHASDRVLERMGRPYSLEQYAALVTTIRSRIPEVSIGSDAIVGFPGETDDDFEQLASYLSQSPLTHVHVFPYSDRPGTAASTLPQKVDPLVIRARAQRLRAISTRLTASFHASQIDSIHRALTIDDGSVAVTGNYLKLKVQPGRARNEWVSVRVVSDGQGELLGG